MIHRLSPLLIAPLLLSLSLPLLADETTQDLIKLLSSEKLSIRLDAEKKLWQSGDSARNDLLEALKSELPETALRAAKVLRFIDLGITTDTPQEIVSLVESFENNTVETKKSILEALKEKKLYRTALLLFKKEKNSSIQSQLRGEIRGLAIIAAREQLLQGNRDEAYRFLVDFPEDQQNVTALAWLAYAEGRIDAEIKSNKESKDPFAWRYQLALLRIKGNRHDAAEIAEQQNLTSLEAILDLLDGKPLKWLRYCSDSTSSDNKDISERYFSIVQQRITHKPSSADAMNALIKISLKDGDYTRRWLAVNALYALGNDEAAAKSQKSINPITVFEQFAERERTDDAVKAIGLDPKDPDFTKYINDSIEQLIADDDSEQVDGIPTILNFLERRGLVKPIEEAFVPKMLLLAENHKDYFNDLFENCISANGGIRKAPESALLVANAYAKDDDVLWGSIIRMAFNENKQHSQWWTWMEKLVPDATKADRFRQLLVLFRAIPDRKGEIPALENSIREFIKNCDADDQDVYRKLVSYAAVYARNTTLAQLAATDDSELDINDLINSGQWALAATKAQELAKEGPEQISTQVWVVCCLYRAGKIEEAEKLEKLYHTLVLGDSTAMIVASSIFQQMGFTDKANYWRNLTLHCSGVNNNWQLALYLQGDESLLRGEYEKASNCYEAYLSCNIKEDSTSVPLLLYRCRKKADMARGFSLLATDRNKAIEVLRECHQSLLADASLADQFFPALRMAGLTDLHNQWFEESWAAMQAISAKYPNDDNIHNSSAWLAARAVLRLDDAEREVTKALKLRPNQAAYLDTLGEVWFARKNREKALECSSKAIKEDSQSASSLREQYFRFANDPFP